MTKHEPMSPAMRERVAAQFKALAEPSRLLLMGRLFDGRATVGELVDDSGLSLANVSKHLGVLHRAGWVHREKDGLSVWYSLADERAFGLCELMCARVRELAAVEAKITAMPRRVAR